MQAKSEHAMVTANAEKKVFQGSYYYYYGIEGIQGKNGAVECGNRKVEDTVGEADGRVKGTRCGGN